MKVFLNETWPVFAIVTVVGVCFILWVIFRAASMADEALEQMRKRMFLRERQEDHETYREEKPWASRRSGSKN
jgi:hypothetical protein